jgi:sec-independent protein translocase protein TatC
MLAVAVCSGVAYAFVEPIGEFLMAPLFAASPQLKTLVYTNLTEALFSYMKLALLVGVGFSFPVLVHQAWLFVAPGLHDKERRTVRTVVLLASGLFVAGVAFAYCLVLPRLLTFLMSFSRANLTPMPKFGEYLTFMARSGLAFGLAFEIPFLMVAAVKTGLVSPQHFKEKRGYSYLAIFGLAFLLTAGDPFSAALLLLPLAALYEVGVLVARAVVS